MNLQKAKSLPYITKQTALYERYRIISLISDAVKTIITIIKNRIKGKIEHNFDEGQFEFISERDARLHSGAS